MQGSNARSRFEGSASSREKGVRLVVTDLDRTLWDIEERIDGATLAALNELRRRGIGVLAATARNHYSTERILTLHDERMPAVLLNGSLGRDVDGSTFHRAAFSTAIARATLAAFRTVGLSPQLTVDHHEMLVVMDDDISSSSGYQDYAAEFTTFRELDATIATAPVLAFGVIGISEAQAVAAYRSLSAVDGLVAYAVEDRKYGGGGWTVMAAPAEAGKWAGVEAYCRARGIDPRSVLAIGDGDNDVEMLVGAGVSCAMAHASAAALDAADHVLSDASGWAGLLGVVDAVG